MDLMVEYGLKDSIGRQIYKCPKCNKNRELLLNIDNVIKCKRCHNLIKSGKYCRPIRLNRLYNQVNPDLSKPKGMTEIYYTWLITEIGRLLNAGTKL